MSQVTGLLTQARNALSDDDNPQLVAEILLSHVLAKPRSWLYTWPEATVTAGMEQQYSVLVKKRCSGIPVAYLTGSREFWSLPLQITEATLIPRPETELLVETVLELGDTHVPLSLLDLGTGSGAIAIAIATERQQWQITATDNSNTALQIAKRNAAILTDDNIRFLPSHWFTGFTEPEQWHIIVSNPPYIAEHDEHLQQGDLRFEPASALASGADGLDDLQQIVQEAPDYLYHDGWLLVEHGMAQGAAVRDIFCHNGFKNVSTRKDLQQHDRLTMGQK